MICNLGDPMSFRHPVVINFWTTSPDSIFRPLSQTHFSKSEFKNGHVSRFCFVFQAIQVILSGKFYVLGAVPAALSSTKYMQGGKYA